MFSLKIYANSLRYYCQYGMVVILYDTFQEISLAFYLQNTLGLNSKDYLLPSKISEAFIRYKYILIH